MSQKVADPREAFLEALKEYDKTLADSKPAIFLGADFINKRDSKIDAILNIIGFIVGLFYRHTVFHTTEPETGNAVVGNDGIYFFATKSERITHHYFLPFNKMSRSIMGRDIVLSKQLSIRGVYSSNGREESYRLNFNPGKEGNEQLRTLKNKLKLNRVTLQKSRAAVISAAVLVLFFGYIIFGLLTPRWTNSYLPMDYAEFRREINQPTHNLSGTYQDRTTSFSARIATGVFTITFDDGTSRDFVGARIAGNDRIFLVELAEVRPALTEGEVFRVTAVGMGAISTGARPENNVFDRFFEAVGVAFGDPRRSGFVTNISVSGVLRGSNYLHMRAVNFETVAAPAVVDSNTFVSVGGNYGIRFVEAYLTRAGAGRNQTNVIMIYYDYEAFAAHSVNRPLSRNFVIYHGETELAFWEGGLRAGGGRNFLTTHNFGAGDVFHARRAVVPVGPADSVRIVRYDSNFQPIFSHEIPVRQE